MAARMPRARAFPSDRASGRTLAARVRRAFRWTVLAAPIAAAVGFAGSESLASRYKAIVVEADTGKVLFSRHADKRHYPASLTKMMTLYLVFEALESGGLALDQRVRVSRRAAGQTPSRLGLKSGRSISVEDAVLAMVTKSANDAATALAEAVGGTEVNFANRMTRTARRIGMKNTVFRNATGLPNRRQYSTARDMTVLARRLRRDFPQYYHYFSTRSFKWGKRTYVNHNKLLKTYKGVDGLKTGYIRASGFNITTSARRNGKRVIGVVLGGRTSAWRDRQMAHLLNVAFKKLETPRRAAKRGKTGRKAVASIRVPAPKPRSSKLDLLRSKPPAPGAASAETGNWGIQVGAHWARRIALRNVRIAVEALPGLPASVRATVEQASVGSRRLYRARLWGFSERLARDACRRLAARRLACAPVRPKGGLVTIASN